MPGQSAEKAAVISEVREKFAAAESAIVTEYRGLGVTALAKLRRSLRPLGAEYKVYKNSLARIAARDTDMAGVESLLAGPTAITFVDGDVSAVAKALRDFAKENQALVLKGGVVDGKLVDAKGLKALADLPSRETMLAQFAGMLQAPLSKTASMLAALPRKTAHGLKALVEQKEAA